MSKAVIAFSGGLDTSFLVPYCREVYGVTEVITCAVNTGGFSEEEAKKIATRSKEVGSDRHIYLDAARDYYDQIITYLIYGNVSRDGYPLCVSSERLVIAQKALEVCREVGADFFIHGSTGAGNDQYRFDVAAQVLGDGKIQCKAPVREFGITRQFSTDYLRARGVTVTEKTTSYSYNPGLWGVSIGGKETLTSDGLIPDDAWYSQPDSQAKEGVLSLSFTEGLLTKLDYQGQVLSEPVGMLRRLAEIGNGLGLGRHYHVGTSVPGKKGRLAYESPAADIVYEAHRTLEKITLSQAQITGKKPMAEMFGQMVHEAKMFDPYLNDIKVFLKSTQRRVTGTCRVVLAPGQIKAVTAQSPYDLLAIKGSTYGEVSSAYSGADAAGSALLHGYEQRLYHSLAGQEIGQGQRDMTLPAGLLDETAELLKQLIKIPSISSDEAKAADFLQKEVARFFPDAAITRMGHNLLIDIKAAKPGPTLLLCSHFDTVAVAASWTRDPFGATVEGDKIYGLGANDAGASIVSMIGSARLAGKDFAGRLLLCLAAEEESGNQGFVKIEPELPRYDAAIFGEPTNMGAAPSMRGSMRAVLRSHGKSCHASRPWQGSNAVDAFVTDIQKLRAIDLKDNSPWKQATIEPTVIKGGQSTNQIPDLIEATLDIRTTPEKNNDWIIDALKKAGTDVEITVNKRRPMHNDPASPLMQAVRAVQPPIADYIFNGSCDMAFATASSIVLGPGQSERSHVADEFIRLPELEQAIGVYAAVIKEFLR